MKFQGAAIPRTQRDTLGVATRLAIEQSCLLAVLAVETDGLGFDHAGRPTMLFEPHVFWRLIPPAKLPAAVKLGIAYERWGERPYPPDSYPHLIQACAIDENAALQSASWGLPQIMGENYKLVGYSCVQDLVRGAMLSEATQMGMLGDYLIRTGLVVALREHNWNTFAARYNGPGQVGVYAGKLAAAYQRFTAGTGADDLNQQELDQLNQPLRRPTPAPNASADDLNQQELDDLHDGPSDAPSGHISGDF